LLRKAKIYFEAKFGQVQISIHWVFQQNKNSSQNTFIGKRREVRWPNILKY